MELRPHDLLRLAAPDAVEAVEPPDWVGASLAAAPWVVVRRGSRIDGRVPVGVRGSSRAERFAAFVRPGAVAARAAPEDLAPGRRLWRKTAPHPVIDALKAIAAALDAAGLSWGPAGGAGFEIATGRRVLTEASDLDLVMRFPGAVDRSALDEAAAIARHAAVRVDAQVETPAGAVSLAECLGAEEQVLLRGADGPRLVARDALFREPLPC